MTWFEVKEHLDIRARQKQFRNTIQVNSNESLEHFMLKAHVCHYLRLNGKEFYTEAVFAKGKGRADIYVIDDDGNYAIEIVHTEDTTKSGKEKYPCPIRFIPTTRDLDVALVQACTRPPE